LSQCLPAACLQAVGNVAAFLVSRLSSAITGHCMLHLLLGLYLHFLAAGLLFCCCLQEVGNVAAFLVSPLSSAITGHCCYVDNGLNIMGLAMDSKTLDRDASA
jgi:enoyl-[acyl-carrier-protein] reductase (NADH)